MVELAAPANSRGPEDFDNCFRFAIVALAADDAKRSREELTIPAKVRVDFVVGENWLVTIADEELLLFQEFRTQDRGETLIGSLTSAALAASLLDWHLTRYLESFERLEAFVDSLDVRMLAGRSLDRSHPHTRGIRQDALSLPCEGRSRPSGRYITGCHARISSSSPRRMPPSISSYWSIDLRERSMHSSMDANWCKDLSISTQHALRKIPTRLCAASPSRASFWARSAPSPEFSE
jgi:Mg2+ and Co2+ transporter CorA